MHQLADNFIWISTTCMGLVLTGSILYRIWKGKPLLRRAPGRSLFTESQVSGTSFRTWYSKLAAARYALVVSVTQEHLIVYPIFPFNLFFLPEICGLEYTIPLARLREVKSARWLGRDGVEVAFATSEDRQERFWLRLRRRDAFLDLLQASLPGQAHPPAAADAR